MDRTELDKEEFEDIVNPARRDIRKTEHIGIEGMSNEKCVEIIQNALSKIDGVESVEVNLEKNMVTVTFDSRKTNMPELHDAILASGYSSSRSAT